MDKIVSCRYCASSLISKILDLGSMPLANSFLEEKNLSEKEQSYQLELYFCESCGIMQVGETAQPENIFHEYKYVSSTSDTTLRHGENLARHMKNAFNLSSNSFILEIGSNDGSILNCFKKNGMLNILGVEPARNISRISSKNGIPTINEFFNEETASIIKKNREMPALILCRNVFAHVPDIHSFVRGLKMLLSSNTVIAIESPYMPDMILKNEFDTIYHEHVFYLSLRPLKKLLGLYDMTVFDVSKNDMHGGSMIYYISDRKSRKCTNNVRKVLKYETENYSSTEDFSQYSRNVETIRESLVKLLQDKKKNFRIAAYGAAAKGNTLLNYCGISTDLIDFIVDRNIHKHGCYAPGSHIPVYPVEELLKQGPDYTLLLAWNYADEILKQQETYRKSGGKFIVPIPSVSIV